MSTRRDPLELPASIRTDPLARRLYPPPGVGSRISSWFSGWAHWLGEKYTALTSTRLRRRCLLGGSGAFCVWWGFSVQQYVSWDFLRMYRAWSFQAQAGSDFQPTLIANEVRSLGLLAMVFGLPLVWMALFDWLRTEKPSCE